MQWVSRCEWASDGVLDHYQGWGYSTQERKFQEVTQTPIVMVKAKQHKEYIESASGNSYYVKMTHRVQQIKFVIPGVAPQYIRVSGYATQQHSNNIINVFNASHQLTSHPGLSFDGISTTFVFDWSRSVKSQTQYLELLIEVTNHYGDILFKEQKGARFTINLQEPDSLTKDTENEDWYYVDLLEQDDEQIVDQDLLVRKLKPIFRKPESSCPFL